MQNEAGEWVGKDVDLVDSVFRNTSHTYRFVKMPWARVLQSLKLGTVDMTLAAAKSPERQTYAHFSRHAYRYSHYVLFVRKDRTEIFDSVKDLRDIEHVNGYIGALRDAIYSNRYYQALKQQAFSKHIVFIDDDKNLPNFTMKGRVDAYIESEIEGNYYLNQRPNYRDKIVPLVRLTTEDEAGSFLMFSKRNVSEAEVTEFDHALKHVHDSGEYARISANYR